MYKYILTIQKIEVYLIYIIMIKTDIDMCVMTWR